MLGRGLRRRQYDALLSPAILVTSAENLSVENTGDCASRLLVDLIKCHVYRPFFCE